MKLYISYTNASAAKARGWPPQGTPIVIETLAEDLDAVARDNWSIILHPKGRHKPGWV